MPPLPTLPAPPLALAPQPQLKPQVGRSLCVCASARMRARVRLPRVAIAAPVPLEDRLRGLVSQAPVMLFMKGRPDVRGAALRTRVLKCIC